MYEDVAPSYEYTLEQQMNHGLHEIYKFLNRGYYTVPEDMNFTFEWQNNNLRTSAASE